MYQIKNIETGETQDCTVRPEWVGGVWECGSFRITDESGAAYKVVEPAPVPPKVSPVEFKLLFTPQERVAIKVAQASDPVIDDFYDIVEDPRLTVVDLGLQSTKYAIGYLQLKGLLTAERAAEILAGKIV